MSFGVREHMERGRLRNRLESARDEAAAVDTSLLLCHDMVRKMNILQGSRSQLSSLARPTPASTADTGIERSKGRASMRDVVHDLQMLSQTMGGQIQTAHNRVGCAKQSMLEAMRLLESAIATRRCIYHIQ